MSSPREAIYDVLQAKKQRAEASAAAAAAADVAAEWEQYEADNRAAYRSYNGLAGPERRQQREATS